MDHGLEQEEPPITALAIVVAAALVLEALFAAGLAGLADLFAQLSDAERLVVWFLAAANIGVVGTLLLLPGSRPAAVFVWLALLAQAGALGVIAAEAVGDANPALGVQAAATAVDLVILACVFAVALACVALAGGPQRGLLVTAIAVVLALGGASVLAATSYATGLACSVLDPDYSRWRDGDNRLRLARAMTRCDTLNGRDRAAVEDTLGRGRGRGNRRAYPLGSGPGLIFPPDAHLVVRYEGDRVAAARITFTNVD